MGGALRGSWSRVGRCLGISMEPAGSEGWRGGTGQAQMQGGEQTTPHCTGARVRLMCPGQKNKNNGNNSKHFFVALLCARQCYKLSM